MNGQPSRHTKERTPQGTTRLPAKIVTAAMTHPHQPISAGDNLHPLVAKRAYEIHADRGFRQGSALDEWLEAEREILNQSRVNNMNLRHQTNAAVEGVIILSPSCDVLYMSPRATQLIKPLAISPTGDPPGVALPTPLRHIGDEVRHQVQASLKHGNGLTCDVTRTICSSGRTLFVQGLGVPNQYDGEFLTTLVVSESPIQITVPRGGL